MIDTLAATIPIRLDDNLFDGLSLTRKIKRETGEVDDFVRHYNLAAMGDPRLTYYPETMAGPRLRFEVSLPKLLGLPPVILSQSQVDEALDLIDAYIYEQYIDAPPVREWTCKRLDAVYAWSTEEDTYSYILAISQMNIGSYRRTPFGPEGVVWKSGAGYRWVKFYDKSLEVQQNHKQKDRAPGVLRYEVSNYRNSVNYLAKRQLKIPQTVERMTRRDVSYFILSSFLERLGIHEKSFGEEQALYVDLLRFYGSRSAATVKVFLDHYPDMGIDMYRVEPRMMTSSTFYRWKKILIDDGFLPLAPRALSPLPLPDPASFGLESKGMEWVKAMGL